MATQVFYFYVIFFKCNLVVLYYMILNCITVVDIYIFFSKDIGKSYTWARSLAIVFVTHTYVTVIY